MLPVLETDSVLQKCSRVQISQGREGSYQKSVTGMSGSKDPLFTLPQLLQHFSVPQDPILTKNHTKIQFKMLKFVTFSVLKSKNWPKIQFRKPYLYKNQFCKQHCCPKNQSVQQAPKFCADAFYKPPFLALFRAAHLYQNEMKVEYSPPTNIKILHFISF